MKIELTHTHEPLAHFSHSSLTDIVLLLLIFFLITSSFIIQEGLQVTLPEAENTNVAEQKQIVISLFNDGRIFVNNEEVLPETLSEKIRESITDPEQQVIVLSSDYDVPLDRAVFVMDEAKGVGATRFFISTVPRENNDSAE